MRTEGGCGQLAAWLALGLLLMYLRKFVPGLAGQPLLHGLAQGVLYAVPLAAGLWLLMLSRKGWEAMTPAPEGAGPRG